MSKKSNDRFEDRRIKLQTDLDRIKSKEERNKLGQYATPTKLARALAAHGLALLPKSMPIRFFDGATNTGALLSGVVAESRGRRIQSATGVEIDPHYSIPARKLWRGAQTVVQGDFTLISAPADESMRATLLICNPPYVRHHHLKPEEKKRLQVAVQNTLGIKFSGLSGLYCYFMALSHDWLCDGGIAGWLIPSEFMDVNYGRQLKEYLLREVTLLAIHRFDPNDAQFDDAVVSSTIVWFRKVKPPANHQVRFSFGGTQKKPAIVRQVSTRVLARADKWTRFPKQGPQREYEGYRLGDLFVIKRGIVTGANDFFIIDEAKARALKLPKRYLRPILPVSRCITKDEIKTDAAGIPLLARERLYLLDCGLSERQIAHDEPALWAYLQSGVADFAQGYICRSRKLWYAQEQRAPAAILCTTAGRSDSSRPPFRFLLNHSLAIATNTLLMLYPKPILGAGFLDSAEALRPLWRELNAINRGTLLANCRVYGGGMHKMEPGELANVPADTLARLARLPTKARAISSARSISEGFSPDP